MGDVNFSGQNTGYPKLPSYVPTNGPGTQVTFQGYMPQEDQQLSNIPQLNTAPLTQLQNFASSTGDSPWAQAQLTALQQSQGQAMGAAANQAQSAGTAATDAAAARGGLSTGALQNLAHNNANNATMASQNVIGQGIAAQQQIRSQDASNKLAALSNLPGQEVQALEPAIQEQSLWQAAAGQNQAQQQQANEYNSGLNVQNALGQNNYNLTNYQNQIAQQAGNEMAAAQANQGKK